MRVLIVLPLAIVLASPTGLYAQPASNGPEWGGMNHQPAAAPVIHQEERAGIRPPPAKVQQEQRSVDQIGHQLMQEESKPPPRIPALVPPPGTAPRNP